MAKQASRASASMARSFTYETTFSKDERRLRCGDARPLRAAHPLTWPLAERGIAHGWWQEKTLSPDTTVLHPVGSRSAPGDVPVEGALHSVCRYELLSLFETWFFLLHGRWNILIERKKVGRVIPVLESHQPLVVDPRRRLAPVPLPPGPGS